MASARTIWKGSIVASILNMPSKMYGGIDTADEIHFKQLCPECHVNIKQSTKCPSCDKTLERNVSSRFPELMNSHVNSTGQAILDGEVVCFDEKGMPSFSRLSHRTHLQSDTKIALAIKTYPVNYVVFDVMTNDNLSLMCDPLTVRKEILASLVQKENGLIPATYLKGNGITYFDIVVKNGYEGVMAKKADSKYLPGKRSDLWLKMKPRHTAIVEITGYRKGEGWRERLGALFISEQGVERGKVGSGLMDKAIDQILSKVEIVKMEGDITLVKPTIQIEISYFERTEAGHFRFPAFRRIL